MIVKVQASIVTTEDESQVLVYDQAKKYQFQGAMPWDLLVKLNGRPKAYFEAELDGTELVIGDEAPTQDW